MNHQKTFEQFESVAQKWINALDSYTEEQFAKKPDEHSWSIGQVCNHLVNGTNRFHLHNIALCLDGKGKDMSGEKKFPGRIVFFLGSFPPVRIKVPSSENYTPKQPSSIGEMRTGFIQLIETMRGTAGKIGMAGHLIKTEHPALGYLNAHEWFALIEMHFRHHLRQKVRLDQFLGVK